MTDLAHPLIAESDHTCWGCPDQYEGTLTDGRWFYLRYRWGVAQLGVGVDLDDAVRDSCGGSSRRISDGLAGIFESDEQRDEVFAALLGERLERAS
jgi:hypothetical protein